MKRHQKLGILIFVIIFISNSLSLYADGSPTIKQANPEWSSAIINVGIIDSACLDPQQLSYSSANILIDMQMEGLMRRSGNKIIPGIASKYTVSSDKLTYTFYLRDAVWTDGKAVTAEDFAFAWLRILKSPYVSEYDPPFYCIKNAKLFKGGAINQDKLGIKVINDKTLQVVLENPSPYFLDLTTTQAYLPMRKEMADRYDSTSGDWGGETITNGPFKFASSPYNTTIYEKSLTYWNEKNVKISCVNLLIYDSIEKMNAAYNNGDIDIYVSDRYDGTVRYVQFNNLDRPGITANANIRKALTLSINRKEFIKQSGINAAIPALSLIPPDIIPGNSKTFREEAGDLFIDNDIKASQDALKLGLQQLKLKKLPELNILISQNEYDKKQANALAKMWKKNLNIDIKVVSITDRELYGNIEDGNYQLTFGSRTPEYNDGLTYVEIFNPASKLNKFRYLDNQFSSLIRDITKEPDDSKRIDLLKKAEKKIVDNFVIAPLYFGQVKVIHRPYINNLKINGSGDVLDITSVEFKNVEKVIKNENPKFSIKTNAYWAKDLCERTGFSGTDLIIMHPDGKSIGIVGHKKVSEIGTDFNSFYESIIKESLNQDPNSGTSEEAVMRINDYPARSFRYDFVWKGVVTSVYCILIDTTDAIYLIDFFTDKDIFEQRRAEFNKMIESIHITK